MLLLIHRALALCCIPCCMLAALQGATWASADEDAGWGPPPTVKQPAKEKPSSTWWGMASLPKMSFSPPSFAIAYSPWGGSSSKDDENAAAAAAAAAAATTTATTTTPPPSATTPPPSATTPPPPATTPPPPTTTQPPATPKPRTFWPFGYGWAAPVPASPTVRGAAGRDPTGHSSSGPGRTGPPTERGTTPTEKRAEVTGLAETPPETSSVVELLLTDTADPPGPVGTRLGSWITTTTTPRGSITTRRSPEVHSRLPGGFPGGEGTAGEEDDKVYGVAGTRTKNAGSAEVSTAGFKQPATPERHAAADATQTLPGTDGWTSPPIDVNAGASLLPDCNDRESSGICNFAYTWESAAIAPNAPRPGSTTATTTTTASTTTASTSTTTTTAASTTTASTTTTTASTTTTTTASSSNQSHNPFPTPNPAMLVWLYTDWNSAMATWGLAWDAHVYGAGCFFAALTLASALNLLCLPLRCPSGCGYFALVSLFLLAAGCARSFSLLYDAYGHRGRLPASAEAYLVLEELPFPCLTAAFGLVFLLLSMRSRMQLSYSAFQRPLFLACMVALHFTAAFGPVALLGAYRQSPAAHLFLRLVSRGAFVALAAFLAGAYFVFYVYVRADSKHIYRLNNTSPTPAERYNRCPFAESRDWDRAAATVCASALFCLACAGLQLYAMLNAAGVTGGEEVFGAWPWWAFQLSCRLCELGVCLTLALVVAQPVYCSNGLPGAGSCWTELLAAKSPILPGTYHWSLSQQEKLAIVDTGGLGLGETESLPLYTLVDERLGSSLNGLNLLYHSNRGLAYRDLDLTGSEKPDGGTGGGGAVSTRSSLTSDSTADLRPPSPIDLRRSIDEALFGESLFPMSLFSPATPLCLSDLSLANLGPLPNGGGGQSYAVWDVPSAAVDDAGLYRTSSCVEVLPFEPASRSRGVTAISAPGAPPSPSPSLSTSTTCSSPERWRGSSSSCASYRPSFGGSSLVLCPSPERRAVGQDEEAADRRSAGGGGSDPQRRYQTLGSASQESLAMDLSSDADRSLQEEFISVCRQMDASSVCSETIDL